VPFRVMGGGYLSWEGGSGAVRLLWDWDETRVKTVRAGGRIGSHIWPGAQKGDETEETPKNLHFEGRRLPHSAIKHCRHIG
jgi:hypothetical protein